MKKVIIVALALVALVAGLSFAGGSQAAGGSSNTYAFVFKSAGNAFGELALTGYKQAVEAAGGKVVAQSPAQATAEGQIQIVEQFIAQKVAAIAIAANDVDALEPVLQKAMKAGIPVVGFDSSPNPASRNVFVNQTTNELVAKVLMNSVLDMSGGSGEYAILSATAQAPNQNAWIAEMDKLQKSDPKYANLKLVKVAYGDDEPDKSTSETQGLLASFPNLKVIVCPTTVGIMQAAKQITDKGLIGKVFIAGLGLPSEMKAYVLNGSCPYFYLWNMTELGNLVGYAAVALAQKRITGKLGDTITAGSMGERKVIPSADGGTEFLLGDPFKWDKSNVEEWAPKM